VDWVESGMRCWLAEDAVTQKFKCVGCHFALVQNYSYLDSFFGLMDSWLL